MINYHIQTVKETFYHHLYFNINCQISKLRIIIIFNRFLIDIVAVIYLAHFWAAGIEIYSGETGGGRSYALRAGKSLPADAERDLWTEQ